MTSTKRTPEQVGRREGEKMAAKHLKEIGTVSTFLALSVSARRMFLRAGYTPASPEWEAARDAAEMAWVDAMSDAFPCE